MKHLYLQMPLSSSEEMEEPWPKKLKIDRSYRCSEEPNKLLERLCCVDKPSSKPLRFPVISWSFSQCIGKLQANDSRNLTTNLRQDTLLKPHENVNLQSMLVGNVSFTETWTFASKDSRTIKNGSSSEFNKSRSSLVTKPDSWVLSAEEREKPTQSGNISKENELPALNAVFYDVLPGNLIAKIKSLPTDGPEFLNNEYCTDYHQVYEILRSNEQYIPKPFTYDENNNSQIQYWSSQPSSFMKGGKSNLKSLVYECKSVMNMNSNIFSCKKQRSENHYFKRNKTFQHIYKPYSKTLKVMNPKLIKCAVLGLFLEDMGIYNDRTSTEKNGPTIFSHIIVQRKVSNENYTKECVIFSSDTRKDCVFSVTANEEQMANLIHSNNPILPGNNFSSSVLWKESLRSPKLMYSLTENFKKCECLASFPTFFEKPSCRHTDIQTVVMAACMQKEKGNTFQENNILKQYNQHGTGRLGNIINLKKQSKSFPNYTGICKEPLMNKNRFKSKDGQGTFCGIVDKQAHFSCSDTFQKICLNAEEAEEIYFVGNIMFHAVKNEEYSKIQIAIDKQISDTGSCPSNHSCDSSMQNLLEQGFQGERSHCPKDSSWYLHNEINYVTFPTNSLNSGNIFKFFSTFHQYFTSVTSHELIDRSIVHVNRWHSETAVHIKREKLNNSSGRQVEETENDNFQEDILLRNIHNSDDIPVKQNVEDVARIENEVILLSHIRKINHSQNLTIPYFEDKSTILSSNMKQQHDAADKNSSLNSELVSKKYEFEMKSHFDMVLKELQMFHEISKENENSFACGERGEINKENGNALPCIEKDIIEEDPLVPSHCEMLDEDPNIFCENKAMMDITMTTVQQNKNEHCSLKDIVLTMPEEQEVPHEFSVSCTSDEELFYSPSEEHCSSCCKQPLIWKPAFNPHSYTEERSFSLEPERGKCFLDGVRKVQPLKTCHRPLRVGLSRRAKPRQLHPYLK